MLLSAIEQSRPVANASVVQGIDQLDTSLEHQLNPVNGSADLTHLWFTGQSSLLGCVQSEASAPPNTEFQTALSCSRDAQALADALLSNSTDSIFILDETACLYCNQRVTEQLGYSPAQIIGQWPLPFGDRTTEQNPSLAALHRGALSGESKQVECVLKRKDGSDFYCELQVFRVGWGERHHVVVIARDSQDRTRFEAELRRHTDFLDNIINAVPDPIFVTDAGQKLVLANDAYCREFLTNQGLVSKICDQTEGTSNLAVSPLDPDSETFSSDQLEHVQTTAAGDISIHSVRRSVFRDKTANSRYIVAVSRDITTERRRQHRLGLLASVFSNSVEGVAILDQGGVVLEANPKLLELFGLDTQRLEGQTLRTLLEVGSTEAAGYWDQLLAVSSWTGKVPYQHPDGRQHWFRLSLSQTAEPVVTDGGQADCQVIALFADITQLEESQQRLEYQSRHDALTGLANRQYFTHELALQLEQRTGVESELAVIRLTMDDFKGINDNFGYDAGDLILAEVAQRLRDLVGQTGLVARIGGDEFAILVTDPVGQSGSAEALAQQVLAFSLTPYRVGDAEVIVNTSIGIAAYPCDGNSAARLMSNADIAMYQAKAAGKNQYLRFSSAMQNRVAQRHALHAALREVIQAGGLTMYYQPKVDAKTGQLAGCEALLRWIREDGSTIPPSEFIPIAEQTGLILPLGDLAFDRVMQTARHWADHDSNLLPIAVNVSLKQFRRADFVDQLLAKCKHFHVQPEWIDLEITESTVADDVQNTIAIFRRLAQLGFKIALDDFGTAYSSLCYLRHFSLRTLKVDRSFVTDLGHDPNLWPIVTTIVGLARGLNLKVVAEGVETIQQQDLLVAAGCDHLQGYLIGRPMPQSVLENWAQNRLREPTVTL